MVLDGVLLGMVLGPPRRVLRVYFSLVMVMGPLVMSPMGVVPAAATAALGPGRHVADPKKSRQGDGQQIAEPIHG
jgi:hypothetical protein